MDVEHIKNHSKIEEKHFLRCDISKRSHNFDEYTTKNDIVH